MPQPQGFRYDNTGKVVPPSFYDKAGNPVYEEPQGWLDTAADVARGAGKGLLHTAKTGGELLRRIPGVNAVAEALPHTQLDVNLTPTNTAQKVGYGAEQIGEFMAPGTLPKKAAVWMAGKAAPLVANAPGAIRTAVGLAPRMATEAATSGAITAAQGGDATTGAAVGATLPVVGKVAEAVGPAVKRFAARQVERFMQPGTKILKYEARQVAPQVLERKIVGTPTSVERLAEAQRKKAGQAVNAAEQRLATAKPGDVVDLANLRTTILRQIRSYTTPAAGVGQLTVGGNVVPAGQGGQQLTVAGREIYHNAAKQFLAMVDQLPAKIPVKQAADLKRQWQDVVRVARGYLEDAPEQAKARIAREAAKAVRKAILRINTVDDLKPAYDEFAFWAKLENILSDTALRRTGQQGWGKKVIATLIMGGAGGWGAGTPGAAAAGALALAVQTPTWKLASAQVKNALADALVEGNLPKIKFLTDRIIKGTVSVATQEQ